MLLFAACLVALAALPTVLAAQHVGHIAALTVVQGTEFGETADISLEIKPGQGSLFIESTPLTRLDTQMSARLARDAACQRSGVDCSRYDFFYVVRVRSSVIGGPSAGGALAVLTYAVLEDLPLRNDTAMTGAILTGNIIGPVGGVDAKISGAQRAGYTRVVVPAWDATEAINGTVASAGVLTKNTNGVTVIEAYTLDDAIEAFTGKRPAPAPALSAPPNSYTAGMERVADTLCQRARVLRTVVDGVDNASVASLETADRQYARAVNASARRDYYSAASLCFSAGLIAQEITLTHGKRESRATVFENAQRGALAMREAIEKAELHTISDLEVTMIASERLADVERELSEMNVSDPEPRALAYASERLETARAWFTLLGNVEGAPLALTDAELFARCRQKVDEAQERVNYIDFVYPNATEQLQVSLREALGAAQRGQSALCILQASQAKAEANAIMSAVSIPAYAFDEVLREKQRVARDAIATMTAQGSFPILGYSYSQYAEELTERDAATAALYTEYSLELASLPIYFPDPKSALRIDRRGLIVFAVGVGIGAIIGILLMLLMHRHHKPPRAPRRHTVRQRRSRK
jgi:uncharacterized protein